MVILTNVQCILYIIILKNIRTLHFTRSKKKQFYKLKKNAMMLYKFTLLNQNIKFFTKMWLFLDQLFYILKTIINDFYYKINVPVFF